MKKIFIHLAIFLFGIIRTHAAVDSDSLGLPGDNLDLAGVLDLFKSATSLDDFEKKINDPANEINNLDLNNDQNVDYIRVVDQVSGDAHAIVLQVPVSADESQDVAVIEIEKDGTESAQLQISGDEELYGENYFIDPSDDDNTPAPTEAKWQGFRPVFVYVNVWAWPAVKFIYAPAYVVYVSTWHWNYYPAYWHPWHPVLWSVHHERVMRYHHHCACVHDCRTATIHAYYHNHRMASPAVHRACAGSHQRQGARQNERINSPNGNQRAGSPKSGQRAGVKSGARRGGGRHR